jgi:Protein of unknown function (DUF664)
MRAEVSLCGLSRDGIRVGPCAALSHVFLLFPVPPLATLGWQMAGSVLMIDDFAKEYLHNDLRDVRETMLWKVEGLSEYDVRRPLTCTGTNLLGLIKHLSTSEAWYFGDVFGRPFPGQWRRWDDPAGHSDIMWAAADEPLDDIIGRYRQAWEYSDETIDALDIDAPGHVPWWPRPEVKLFNILVHVLTETNRHAGHADILREQLDGAVGFDAESTPLHGRDAAFWESHRAQIEQAAKAADRRQT